jgi:hypothetical protein
VPGPAPNPNARRRNARPGFLILPAEGYRGEIPPWPLAGRQTGSEKAAWEDLWRKPQGAAWAQLHLERSVALYVRTLVRAERAGAAAFLVSTARQLGEGLGLSAMSMLRLRWEVASDQVAEQRDQRAQGDGEGSRWADFKVVDGGQQP